MTTIRLWSGREARALREAKRMSIREFARHLGISDRMISKWESGAERVHPRPVNQAALDTSLAQSCPEVRARFALLLVAHTTKVATAEEVRIADPLTVRVCGHRFSEADDMNRRELLRVLSMASTLIATYPLTEVDLDRERLSDTSQQPAHNPVATVDECRVLNTHLWRSFMRSEDKTTVLPLVRQQLGILVDSCQHARGRAMHRQICSLISDLSQLSGEIFFDLNQYTDAAHCYAVATAAGKEAGDFDLWACALTRHSFIAMYEHQFDKAVPMLELAGHLADRGDQRLSTRHWVSSVQAQAFAGLGDFSACEQALGKAARVQNLRGNVHNGGWLRFDRSRLLEEQGACYVALKRPDLAEAALVDALPQQNSARRRGSVLVDLSSLALQSGNLAGLQKYASAAVALLKQTRSGVIARKLAGLRAELPAYNADSYIRHLDTQIDDLVKDCI